MNSANIGNTSCICSANSQLLGSSENPQQLIQPPRTPATSGSEANYLADSLGVSPLYRQQDSHVNFLFFTGLKLIKIISFC